MPNTYSLPPVLQRIESIGGAVFTTGAYNLNLFGIRSRALWNGVAGSFDDLLGCAYRETPDGPFRVHWWPGTTDPGVYWMENPMRVSGCAAMVEDRQYRSAYQVGQHRGQYRALVQRGPVAIYRDANLDRVLNCDPSTIVEGVYGINIHKAGAASNVVGKWSAGCQVHATEAGFNDMMSLVDKALEVHPTWTRFTYTLLLSWAGAYL
tara:strand:- start:8739 stop:9359 length:621 start_codon:yes stop_codon:yes gene_type:complete